MPDYAVFGIHFYGTALYGLPPRFEFNLDYFVANPVGYDRIKVEWGHPSGAWDLLRLVRGNYGFPMDQTEGRLLLEASNPQFNVRVAATTNLSLSGLAAIDGVTPSAGDRILAIGQTTGSQNGIYVAAAGAWARATDFDTDTEILSGVLIGALEGTANKGVWQLTSPEPQTIGSTTLTFVKTALNPDPGTYEDSMVTPLRFHYYSMFLRQTGVSTFPDGVITSGNASIDSASANFTSADIGRAISGTGIAGGATILSVQSSSHATMSANATATATGVSFTITGRPLNWVRAGNAVTLMPQDFGYTDRLYELVPGVFRDDDIYISSSTDQGMLQTYIGLFGYSIDQLRSDLESLRWTADPEKMSLGLLPYLAEQLGFPYEAELGGDLTRRQLLKAVYIYKYKGTQLGVEAAANVLTGWVASAVADTPTHVNVTLRADRVNEVTNPNAETNTTGWTAGANTTLARVTTQHLYGTAAFQLTATGTGDISMSTATGTSGMPVTENLLYTASMYNFKASGTARNVRVDLIWYDVAGAAIGSPVLGTEVTQVLGAWTNRPSVSATAPAGAKTAAMKVTAVAAGAGENQYFDGAMFGPGSLSEYFDGSTSMAGTSIADYLWEGTANASRSHYYHRRAVKNSRLVTRLPDFLPSGMTFTALYAQTL